MSYGSGLGASIGFAAESTFGTRATPTRFLEFESESLKLDKTRIPSKALRAGARTARSDRFVSGKRSVGGSVKFEVADRGSGLLLKHCLGSLTTAQPNAGTYPTVYEHTFKLGDPLGLSLTGQVGRPDVAETVRPFDYLGLKVTDWTLSSALEEILGLDITVVGTDEKTDQALATVSYPATQALLHWGGCAVNVAGSAYMSRSVSVKGSLGLDDSRYALGSVYRKEPVANAQASFDVEIDSEFQSLVAYNRYDADTIFAVTAFWTGAVISGPYSYALEVTLPACRLDGDTPNVGGTELLTQPLKLTALDDGTATSPITIVYRTTDATP